LYYISNLENAKKYYQQALDIPRGIQPVTFKLPSQILLTINYFKAPKKVKNQTPFKKQREATVFHLK
jgi:hypothetical protein